jgi:hypothetical protein
VVIEENTVIGGLGSAAAEVIAAAGFSPGKKFKRIGIPDVFPDRYGSQAKPDGLPPHQRRRGREDRPVSARAPITLNSIHQEP